MTVYYVRLCALILILVSLCGCGPPRAANTTEVTGNVTLDGKAVDGASVAFIGSGGAVLASNQTDSNGNFKLYAAMGKNAVTVSKGGTGPVPQTTPDMLMPSDSEYQAMPPPPTAIPAKYADPKTSGIEITVAKGMAPVAISLSN